MTAKTPTTADVRRHYAFSSTSIDNVRWDDGVAEFDRWLAAHDQGIRDAVCVPPADPDSAAGLAEKADGLAHDIISRLAEAGPAELIEAAFDAAHKVPSGATIPAGTPLFSRNPKDDGAILYVPNGFLTPRTQNSSSGCEYRTLTPLPPVIPDDCNYVWANWDEDGRRYVWNRHPKARDDWHTTSAAGELIRARESNLIDPKPVHEEGERAKRVVRTEEGLRSLPIGTVVLDRDDDVAKVCDGLVRYAGASNVTFKDVILYGPFTVLWEPGDDDE